MYYLLVTDRIVTEHDIRVAYEIACGSIPGIHPGHYEEWKKEVYGIIRSIPEDEITVEQLIKGKCLSQAVMKYSKINGCSIQESKEAICKLLYQE
jgi:hypothetical protein